jgi:hypothetical protein
MKTARFALICLLIVVAGALVWRGLRTRCNRLRSQPQTGSPAVVK